MKLTVKLWIGIVALIIISPLGLLLPEHFKAGSAWGEWGIDEIRRISGHLPEGLAKLSGIWNALMPDYALKGSENKGLLYLSLDYIISAIAGVIAVAAIVFLIGKMLSKKDH